MSKILKQANRQLWLFGLFKIPLLWFCSPKIIELDEERIVVRIKLKRRTRNHLNSLYLGAFAIGADIAGGFQAYYIGVKHKRKISLAFKNLNCEFLKRAEDDVYFVAESGAEIMELVQTSKSTGERQNMSVPIKAFTGYPLNPELVAEFNIGLSIKDKT